MLPFQAVNRLVMNLVQLVLINASRWSLCTPRYEIFDTTGRLMYTIEGICCYIKCCADVPFKVTCGLCFSVLTLYCVDRPKPPNPSYAQTVQNQPVNSQFVGLSFNANTSFFYVNQPAQTADLRSK